MPRSLLLDNDFMEKGSSVICARDAQCQPVCRDESHRASSGSKYSLAVLGLPPPASILDSTWPHQSTSATASITTCGDQPLGKPSCAGFDLAVCGLSGSPLPQERLTAMTSRLSSGSSNELLPNARKLASTSFLKEDLTANSGSGQTSRIFSGGLGPVIILITAVVMAAATNGLRHYRLRSIFLLLLSSVTVLYLTSCSKEMLWLNQSGSGSLSSLLSTLTTSVARRRASLVTSAYILPSSKTSSRSTTIDAVQLYLYKSHVRRR